VATQWDYFLIHSSSDKPSAQDLYERLSPPNRVFLDQVGIGPGDNWFVTLQDAVQNARTFVVLVSPRIVTAHYAQDEIIRAIGLARSDPANRKVVPVLLEPTPVMPYGLGPFQCLDVRREGGTAGVAARLIRDFGPPPGAGPVLPPAPPRPRHSLEEYPATGHCPRERLTMALINAVADGLEPAMAPWLVNEANAFRRSVPGEEGVPVVNLGFVPPALYSAPFVFWSSVLDQGRINSPRMLAALLLSTNTNSFSAPARNDYNALLSFLRQLPPQ
jgi:hypothetical protein